MSESIEPRCEVCAIPARMTALYQHGDVWLCKKCERKADQALCDLPAAGTPYGSELAKDSDAAAQEARG